MSFHGNDKKNPKPHHLYCIIDKETDDVFKYGISDKPIGKDGLSSRMREQIDFLNLVSKWLRYFGQIMIFNISGRAEAAKIERKHIDDYREEHGRNPLGNRK